MKNILNYTLVLGFICFFQTTFAQEKNSEVDDVKTKKELKKEAIIKKYSWTESIFEKSEKDLGSVNEYIAPNGSVYVIIDLKGAKTMYNTSGETYCADHASLSCLKFYELVPGNLSWTND